MPRGEVFTGVELEVPQVVETWEGVKNLQRALAALGKNVVEITTTQPQEV